MKIDYSPRASGKTTKLIQWLQEDFEKRYLITFSTREEQRLRGLYPDIAEHIFYWETYVKNRIGRRAENEILAVDNADYILERVLGAYIHKVSITKEELNLRDMDE